MSRVIKGPSATNISSATKARVASKAYRLAKASRPTQDKKDGTCYNISAWITVVPG